MGLEFGVFQRSRADSFKTSVRLDECGFKIQVESQELMECKHMKSSNLDYVQDAAENITQASAIRTELNRCNLQTSKDVEHLCSPGLLNGTAIEFDFKSSFELYRKSKSRQLLSSSRSSEALSACENLTGNTLPPGRKSSAMCSPYASTIHKPLK